MEEKSKLFYDDLVANGYKLPDYETFKTSLQDQTKANAFYKDLSSSGFKLPDFDTFYGIFKPSEPVQEPVSEPVQEETGFSKLLSGATEFLGGINQTVLDIPADVAETFAIASAFTERQLGKLGVPGANPDIKASEVSFITNPMTGSSVPYMKATEEYRKMVDEIAPVSDDFKQTFAGGVSQGLGQVLGMVMTGGGSKATQIAKMAKSQGTSITPVVNAGKELLKNMGSKQGLIGGSMNASANYRQAIQEGATEEQALRYGIENMVVGSVMENLPIQSMFSRLSKVAPDAKLLDVIKDGLVGAGEEAVTEGFQTTYENMSAQRIYDVSKAMLEGVGDASAVGGTVGFILNSMMSALTGRRARMSAPDQAIMDKAIEEAKAKIETVEENNKKVEETVNTLENTGDRTLNNGASDLDFIENPDGTIELAEDGLSQPDAEAKKLLLEKRYPNVEFQVIDNTNKDDPYAEADFTVIGRPKSNAKYSKGSDQLSKNQVELLIQGATDLAELEGLNIENDPELEAEFAQKVSELQPTQSSEVETVETEPKISDVAGETVNVKVGGINISGQVAVDEGGKVTLEAEDGTIYELDQDTPFTEYVRPVSISPEGDFEVNGDSYSEARIVVEDGVEKALMIKEDGTSKAITNPLVVEEIKYRINLAELESMSDSEADAIWETYQKRNEESNKQRETETTPEEGTVETDEDRRLREATEEIDLIEELALAELEDVESKAKLVKFKPETMKEEKVYLVKKNEDGTYTATLNGRKVARPEITQKLGEIYEGETNAQIEDLQKQTDQLKADVEEKLFGKPKSKPESKASKKPTGEKQSTPKNVQQKPVDKTDDTKIQVDETTKQKETSKGDSKKSTPKKTSGTTKRIQKIAKEKKQFFQDIKKDFGFNSNATSATVAKRYDEVKSMDKPSKEDLAFVEAVDKAEKTKYIKPSMKGKVPKSERSLSKNQSKAMSVNVGKSYYDMAIQALIGNRGGLLYQSIVKEAFGGSPLQEMRARVGLTASKEAGGLTIEELVEKVKGESDIDIDESKLRNAIISVVKDHNTTEEMANTLLERNRNSEELISEELSPEEVAKRREMSVEKAIAENYTTDEWNSLSTGEKVDYLNEFYQYDELGAWTEEYLELYESGQDFSDNDLSEAVSFLETMTDEELQEYADGYEAIEGEFAPDVTGRVSFTVFGEQMTGTKTPEGITGDNGTKYQNDMVSDVKELSGESSDIEVLKKTKGKKTKSDVDENPEKYGFHGGTLGDRTDFQTIGYIPDQPFTGYYFFSDRERATRRGDRSKEKNNSARAVDFTKYNLLKPDTNSYWVLKASLKKLESYLFSGNDVSGVIKRLSHFMPDLATQIEKSDVKKLFSEWKTIRDKNFATRDYEKSKTEAFGTFLLKQLGYEGVDVRGLKEQQGEASPDSSAEGSVIFDLKEGTVVDITPKSKIEEQKSKIRDIVQDLKDQINEDKQGIIVDFEAKAKADIKFYNTLKNLIVEYARLKGLQFNEFIADLQKLLGQRISKADKAYLKSLWDTEKKATPKRNVMSENKDLTKDQQVKQGLEELLASKERLAKERLNRERQKAAEAIKSVKDKAKAKLDSFENIKKTMVEFIKMDLKDIPVDSFTKGEFVRVLGQINRAKTDWSLNLAIEEAYRIFGEAGKKKRINVARKKAMQARKNIKSGKIGVLPPNSPLDQMLKINPKIIPQRIFDQYESIVNEIGARKTVLSPREKSELSKRVSEVMNEVDRDNSLVNDLKSRYDSFDDKAENYSGTILRMFQQGIISEEELQFMKLRKSDIFEKTPTEKQETSQEELDDAIKSVLDAKNSVPDPSNLFSKDENKVLRFFKSITKADLSNMDLKELSSIYSLMGNLENNYIPALSEKTREKIEGLRNSKRVKPILDGYNGKWIDFLSKTKAGIKNKFFKGNTTAMREKIRMNPLAYIDQSLRNFQNTEFYDSTFRKLASSYADFDTDFKTVLEKLLKAESMLKNQFESRAKMMMMAIQEEFESNPDAKVHSAKDWLEATISDKNSIYTKEAKNKLQDIFDSISTDGELDLSKAEGSLSTAEKSARKAIAEINQYLTPIADWTATVIRGNRVPIHENYIHLPRATKGGSPLSYDPKTMGGPLNPSTKSGALIERTGKTHAISFDVFDNVLSGAKQTLMDYHMTPTVREMNRTFAELESMAETEQEVEAAYQMKLLYEEAIENVIGNSMIKENLPDAIFNEVARKGYQAVLSGVGKSASELVSNAIFAGGFKLNETVNGVKILNKIKSDKASAIAKNVGSVHSSRLYNTSGMDSKHTDFGGYNTKKLAKTTGLDENFISRLISTATDNKVARHIDNIQSALLSKPDQLVARPIWTGVFNQSFINETGQDPDFDKIASNDQDYMERFSNAIEIARNEADDTVTEAVASANPFDGILKNTQAPGGSAFGKYINTFNSYMTRFAIYEYNSAVKGVQALIGNGKMSKEDGAKLLTALSVRLMFYDLMTETVLGVLYQKVAGLISDQKEEEKEELGDIITRSFMSSMIMLLLNRNMGNVAKAPINYAIELANKEYGEGVTYTGEYDAFTSSVVYPLLPVERQPGSKGIPQQLIENTAGPMTPSVKTAFRSLTVLDRAVTSKTKKARDRNMRELMTRTPFEIAGNLGYIPAYKDFRKVFLNVMYNAEEKIKESETSDSTVRKFGER